MGDQELPHKDTLIIAPGQPRATMLEQLNERSRTVFRQLVETYLETGEPVGSRTLSRSLPLKLSAASIRNVMSDLEHLGLLRAPHTSAGRLPSERGLRLFVDGLLEIGDVSKDERETIESKVAARGRTFEDVLQDATATLSGLSQCAGFVMSSKSETTLKHIEFVSLGPGQGLVVTVAESGLVENRLIEIPPGLPPSALQEATNYLNARLRGRTIAETRGEILSDIEARKVEIDELTQRVVEAGLAIWSSPRADESERTLIVRGQATLLENLDALEDLERVRMLFDDLERKRDLLRLLETAEAADGVQIFIGSESKLFSLSGSSVIVAPYKNSALRILGVIGVIGPTRLNYARVIPMVDLTARAIGKMLS